MTYGWMYRHSCVTNPVQGYKGTREGRRLTGAEEHGQGNVTCDAAGVFCCTKLLRLTEYSSTSSRPALQLLHMSTEHRRLWYNAVTDQAARLPTAHPWTLVGCSICGMLGECAFSLLSLTDDAT